MKKGFTLIEVLTGLFVFSLVLSLTISIFISIIEYQRHFTARQELLNQLSYAQEYISRALRFAVREDGSYGCLTNGLAYEKISESKIRFINHLQNDQCQEFFVNNDQLWHDDDTTVAGTTALTSDKFKVRTFEVKTYGASFIDTYQPRATIFIKAQAGDSKINTQTTVSQRNLDM